MTNKLASRHQSAFIQVKKIIDATLIAMKCLTRNKRQKLLDFYANLTCERDFDKVNWPYLLRVQNTVGFGERWVIWIRFCITTVKYLVIVNGNAGILLTSGIYGMISLRKYHTQFRRNWMNCFFCYKYCSPSLSLTTQMIV